MKDSFVFILIAVMALVSGGQTVAQDDPLVRGTLMHDGLERTYELYVPSTLDPSQPAPLLIGLHGGAGTGADVHGVTLGGFSRIADRENAIVVYPNGVEGHWNDGRIGLDHRSVSENIDDVGFIAALIDELAATYNIDLKRVYVTGLSNGGAMSFRLACDLGDRIAAAAPVIFTMAEEQVTMCNPTRPVPILIMNGTADPIIPYEGGQADILDVYYVGQLVSTAASVDFWRQHNQCPETAIAATETLRDRVRRDDSTVERTIYGPCADGSEVVLYTIVGGGHTWPGGIQYLPQSLIGPTNRDIRATDEIWAFFSRHTLP